MMNELFTLYSPHSENSLAKLPSNVAAFESAVTGATAFTVIGLLGTSAQQMANKAINTTSCNIFILIMKTVDCSKKIYSKCVRKNLSCLNFSYDFNLR